MSCLMLVVALSLPLTYACPDDIAGEVRNATGLWDEALGGALHPRRVSDASEATVVFAIVRESDLPGFRGWTDMDDGRVHIKVVGTANHRDAVILHELGHALGLGHSRDRSSIMFHAAKASASLSDEDVARIRKAFRHRK